MGYCGPAAADQLLRVACGNDDIDVTPLARRFSGAWPYQCLIAELTGEPDPLSQRVGRAYWTGNELTGQLDRVAFGEQLLARFGAQAGHYWDHLDQNLLTEVTPTHIFHVLGVYPWTRLLPTGLPEPLHVLDSCRIRVGEVRTSSADEVVIATDTLTYRNGTLSLTEVAGESVQRRTAHGTFTPELAPGDLVAVHWGFACDLLTPEQGATLRELTDRQLELAAPRLHAAR